MDLQLAERLSDLFGLIGTAHGSGDGSSTFNVPDLRGEFVRGWDDGRGVDSGRNFASSQSDQNEARNHTAASTVTDPGHFHTTENFVVQTYYKNQETWVLARMAAATIQATPTAKQLGLRWPRC